MCQNCNYTYWLEQLEDQLSDERCGEHSDRLEDMERQVKKESHISAEWIAEIKAIALQAGDRL
jgi:hypothetical protein